MKTSCIAPCLLAACLISGCGSQQPRAAQSNPAQSATTQPSVTASASLEGTWEVVLMEVNGKSVPLEARQDMRFIITKSMIRITGEKGEASGYTLDPKQTPAAIDFKMERPNETMVAPGIYELDRDTLKICFAGPRKPRPTEFASKPDQGHTLFVLERPAAAPPGDK